MYMINAVLPYLLYIIYCWGILSNLQGFWETVSKKGELNLSFQIAQNTPFEAKRWQYTTGNVIQRLFNIDPYTYLVNYRYRWSKR